MVRWLVAPFVVVIFGLPPALVIIPALLWPNTWTVLATVALGPMLFSVLFVLTAGLLSLPFQKAIVPGKFPRDLSHPIYGRRRLYGLCWTCVYYNKPVYFICLTVPALKRMMFRLFGYRGQMEFTLYPDTWIRDLPLLEFGQGAYISNRATLGTNMALSNGKSLVDRIRVGKGAMVGHLSMLAPGVVMGEGAEVGVGVAVGLRVELGEGSLVQPTCALNHHAKVGPRTVVGSRSYVGMRADVGAELELPPASCVPARAQVRDRHEVDMLVPAVNGGVS